MLDGMFWLDLDLLYKDAWLGERAAALSARISSGAQATTLAAATNFAVGCTTHHPFHL